MENFFELWGQKLASLKMTHALLANVPDRKVRHMSVGAIRRFRLAMSLLTLALAVLVVPAFLAPGLVWPVAMPFAVILMALATLLAISALPAFLREQRDSAVALREQSRWREQLKMLRQDRVRRIYPAMRKAR